MTQAAAESLIHLDGVTKVFYTDEVETHALAEIHMELKPGEYVSISGPSGCGKATLLAAQSAIERNQYEVAGLQLNAYEQQLRALVEGRQLTEVQGAKLLAGATLIRQVMEEEKRR